MPAGPHGGLRVSPLRLPERLLLDGLRRRPGAPAVPSDELDRDTSAIGRAVRVTDWSTRTLRAGNMAAPCPAAQAHDRPSRVASASVGRRAKPQPAHGAERRWSGRGVGRAVSREVKGREGPFGVDGGPERSPWARKERSRHHRALRCRAPSQTPAFPSMSCLRRALTAGSPPGTEGLPPSSSASPPRAARPPSRESAHIADAQLRGSPGRKLLLESKFELSLFAK